MTRFQKMFLVVAMAFLAVLVYDRIKSYREEAAAREAAREKEIWDSLHRCEDAVPYPSSQTPKADELFNEARKGCRDFWIPQLSRK